MYHEVIKDNEILARVIRGKEAWGDKSLSFFSNEEEFVQAGSWNYSEGKELKAHSHNKVIRSISHTQEVIFIKSGSLVAYIYDKENNLVEEVTAYTDDILIMLAGGHGYKILEDGTKVLEIKNGPYLGPNIDRKRFE